MKKRHDLKVIVTSATIDSDRFAAHFADENGKPAPVLNISGRTYPVEVRYAPIEDDDESDDKHLTRAGLDYWHFIDIHYYENINEFFEKNKGFSLLALFVREVFSKL